MAIFTHSKVLLNATGAFRGTIIRCLVFAQHVPTVCVDEFTFLVDICALCSFETSRTKGADCAVDGSATQTELALKPGYWRIEATSTTVHPCPLPFGCVGAAIFSNEGDGYCGEGYTGLLIP